MDEYIEVNRASWNERTAIHAKSQFYDIAGFKAGRNSLNPLEIEEMGDLSGKSLLHLQCHFGQDTLSWARLGATVTGADLSDESIKLAQALAAELNIAAKFVCANLYDLPLVLEEQFDIVYTGGGALNWLPDMTKWAKVVSHFLKPGGFLYLGEFHPYAMIFANEADIPGIDELKVLYSYFYRAEPHRFEDEGSYTDGGKGVHIVSYEWFHPTSEVITALLDAGLYLTMFHEFPYTHGFAIFPFMEKRADGNLWMKDDRYNIPLSYSLMAVKPTV